MKAVKNKRPPEEIKKDQEAELASYTAPEAPYRNFILNLPLGMRLAFGRHFYGKKSLASAVKLKCLDCCCLQKEEVRLCTVETCPLHKVRPYK